MSEELEIGVPLGDFTLRATQAEPQVQRELASRFRVWDA
jgi:hypothetical protein